MPKSVIFGICLSSNSILSGLMSQWMIFGLQPSCRYSSPLAMPIAASERQLQHGRLDLMMKLAKVPPCMYSKTSFRCGVQSSACNLCIYVVHPQKHTHMGIHNLGAPLCLWCSMHLAHTYLLNRSWFSCCIHHPGID
uniref:Uncharacterized protein n=1 Tax=Setaria viridis TaxID=4556 RepID=A0A4U6V017_SETVI|nr:hypothetical protein SEVIR_4G223105v2 [Setaria viridis]